MEHLPFSINLLLAVIAFIAGTIDSIAGGGGLITTPAALMVGMNPIFALGTVKLQAAICELSAALHFMKKSRISYRPLMGCFIFTTIGSIVGTILLQITSVGKLQMIIPWLLLAVFIYYFWSNRQKNLYQNETLKPDNKKFFLLGSSIGFYNGFFGPGTGAIWPVALVKAFHLKLQRATMYTKPLNFCGNLTALSIFIMAGRVDYRTAIFMAIGSYLGGKLGASLVIYKDSKWLTRVFTLMMIVSIAATFFKYY